MYKNLENINCKKNPRRTPSNSPKSKSIEILLWKKTTDEDLSEGVEVCYQDITGVYSKIGNITDKFQSDGTFFYLLNNAMGSYVASELKLIKS